MLYRTLKTIGWLGIILRLAVTDPVRVAIAMICSMSGSVLLGGLKSNACKIIRTCYIYFMRLKGNTIVNCF